MESRGFTVDTHIFRELGTLLVGRDSTALTELIKNAYDADATEVTVHGESLRDRKKAQIVISDNGTGMTEQIFRDGFLRIASRLKEKGKRQSLQFKRRFTGSKGIGRLAAHKLAHRIDLQSNPDPTYYDTDAQAIEAQIDWDKIEHCVTLEEANRSGGVSVVPVKKRGKRGTRIVLSPLRRKWTDAEISRFHSEVLSFRPPAILTEIPSHLHTEPLLRISNKHYSPIGHDEFEIKLEGDLRTGDEYWQDLANQASMIIEIVAQPEQITYSIVPTKRFAKEVDKPLKRYLLKQPHPNPKTGPFFAARILEKRGAGQGSRKARSWLAQHSGIRIYLEGFRVLPYGDSDDWLNLYRDYRKRDRTLSYLQNITTKDLDVDPEEGLSLLSGDSYFGAIFLKQDESNSLQMLVNREGFVEDSSFEFIRDTVRTGLDLSVRYRASATKSKREEWRETRQAVKRELETGLSKARESLSAAREQSNLGKMEEAVKFVGTAIKITEEKIIESKRKHLDEEQMRDILAAIGLQMAAFVHDIHSFMIIARALQDSVEKIRSEWAFLDKAHQKKLAALGSRASELLRGIEKLASYLTDISSPDSRRRRSKHSFHERLEISASLLEPAMKRQEIKLLNEIPANLVSPPMFAAELSLIFSNLLSNAIKASGRSGKIHAVGERRSQKIVIRIENTGNKVRLSEGERWFQPFESTTEKPDPMLGQGMGMGLPLTRKMLDEYGAEIRFVAPSAGYKTSVELTFH